MSEWHQTFIRVLNRASRPDGRCTVKCMLLQKGAVNYCGCISRIEGAYIRIVGASAPTKRYKITPLAGCLLVLGVLSWLNGGWADDVWLGLHFVPIYLEKVPNG